MDKEKKKPYKKNLETIPFRLSHTHTRTDTYTHTHARTHTHTGLGQQQQQQQQEEMRAKASTRQATSVLRITKFDSYSAVLRESETSQIKKKNIILSQYK